MWSTFLFAGTVLFFVTITLTTLFHLRWMRRLPPLPPKHKADPTRPANAAKRPVRCSIVIPARNEEARIETTVRNLLAQCEVEVEVVVVDDRSTDRTAEIVNRLAQADARVRLARITQLPEGWLGKCFACHTGACATAGDWILFTDADCWLKRDAIARALHVADREGVEHVTLTPGVKPETLGAAGWHIAVLITMADWISAVNRDRPKAYMGLGAFNLVKASTYRESGGYPFLRMTVLDDVKLGLVLRRAGKRTRAFIGGDDVECHWGTTVRGMIQIMEKNYFAAIDFNVPVLVAASGLALVVLGTVIAGLFAETPVGWAAGASPLLLIWPASILARRLGWDWRTAAVTPFILPLLWYALLNSGYTTLRQGGIRWRDTFYSLEALRAGNFR